MRSCRAQDFAEGKSCANTAGAKGHCGRLITNRLVQPRRSHRPVAQCERMVDPKVVRVPLLDCEEQLQRFRRLSPVVKLASQKGGGVGPQACELWLRSQLPLGLNITPPNRTAEGVAPFVRVRQSEHGPQVIPLLPLSGADEPVIEGVRQMVMNAACLNSHRGLSGIECEYVDSITPKCLLVGGGLDLEMANPDFLRLKP